MVSCMDLARASSADDTAELEALDAHFALVALFLATFALGGDFRAGDLLTDFLAGVDDAFFAEARAFWAPLPPGEDFLALVGDAFFVSPTDGDGAPFSIL